MQTSSLYYYSSVFFLFNLINKVNWQIFHLAIIKKFFLYVTDADRCHCLCILSINGWLIAGKNLEIERGLNLFAGDLDSGQLPVRWCT